MKNHYDVIVIGLGSMGSAALYHMAKQGLNVLGIEQFSISHSQGSHHGDSRIIRFAYDEGAHYVDMALRAKMLWQDLERESSRNVYFPVGGIYVSDSSQGRFVDKPIKIAQEYGFEHLVLTGTEINKRFPSFNLPEHFQGFYEPASGYLLSEVGVQTHVDMARKSGAHVLDHMAVRDISGDDKIQVITDQNSYTSDKLIISAGAWTTQLMPQLTENIKISRNTVCWFKPAGNTDIFSPGQMPIFTLSDQNHAAYGFPDHSGRGVKIGIHDEYNFTALDQLDRTPLQSDIKKIKDYADAYFNFKDIEVSEASVCLYSMTPDHDFIIGAHPARENIFIAAGFSGHGYKFAPVIGEILADFVRNQKPEFDLSPFNPDRF